MTNIHIIHRSIRIHDNTSLIQQIKEQGSVQVIFIFTPEQINVKKNKYFSNNSVQFMIESLKELHEEIKKHGGKLLFFYGDNIKVLSSLHKTDAIKSISFNFEYTPYGTKRSKDIHDFAKKENIIIYEKEDYALYDILPGDTCKKDGTPYLVYTPYMKHLMNDLKVREVDKFNKFEFDSNSKYSKNKYILPFNEINKFYTENKNINVNGGRSNSLKILKHITNFKNYLKDRDYLTYKTTFLSASLHFGTVSIRETYFAMLNNLGKNSGLIRELIWRQFYMEITYHFPHVLHGQIGKKNIPFKKEYDKIKWSYNTKNFERWCNGTTGFPLVDACMKQLNVTGYMHNRGRMIVASFLTKDLHIDWRLGEKYFATKLVDYDPMSNSGGWGWCSSTGTDAQPYFRIFNPWTQSLKYDKDCEYIKYWLPELKDVPSKNIHNWYKFFYENIYHKPIINHDDERKVTLDLFKIK
jgi:deoxyribodipyrimidine photo-lyase